MPNLQAESPLSMGRLVMPVAVYVMMPLAQVPLVAQETPIVSLKEFISTEVRQQGFTLPSPAKVHVYARGGGIEQRWNDDQTLFAYGWVLNATTREVVWQMSGANSRRQDVYRVADQYIDLPAGSYEAYFSNHGFGRETLFSQWTRNIDRRRLAAEGQRRPEEGIGFLSLFGADTQSQLRFWRDRAPNYGMEIYAPATIAGQVKTFEAPLRWKNIFVTLAKAGDNAQSDQAFRLSKPVSVHVYAIGEGRRNRELNDSGWILDARTRKRVWEMRSDRAQYAGGARKNLRQVETIQLPAGDYIASFVSDDSHSPADWNAAPPCDPALHGLTLSIASDADFPRAALIDMPKPGNVLAELVRVRDDEKRTVSFVVRGDEPLRVYAIGEGTDRRLEDYGWIEDTKTGKKVWSMEYANTRHAGGATKNRMVDEAITLPKGSYTLHFKTDDSHAYGDWNSDRPRDPEHYGVTIYTLTGK